jgi:putative SOS response-associated peptidase YedK
MCGKFTAQAAWREVVAFSQPLTGDGGGGDGERGDEIVIYRVGGPLPVIIWDREAGKRRVVPMRWGLPSPKDWRRRSETIDELRTFRTAFEVSTACDR